MRLARPIASWLAFAAVAAAPASAAPGDLLYARSYPELGTGGRSAVLNAGALQPVDGRLVVAGTALQPSAGDADWVVARVDPATGDLDGSFGEGGIVRIPINLRADGRDDARAVAIGPGGRIVVAGTVATPSGTDMAVVALTPNGERDTDFGPQGLRTFDFGRFDTGHAVLVDAGGAVTIGGGADGDPPGFGVARVDSHGEPIAGFGTGGRVVTPIGDEDADEIDDLVVVPASGRRSAEAEGEEFVAVGTEDTGAPDSDLAFMFYAASIGAVGDPTVLTQTGYDRFADAEIIDEQLMVGSSDIVDFGQVARLRVFDLRTFAPVEGAGGEIFGRPSAFGGLGVDPDGTPLALGIGPVGGPVDEWLLGSLNPSAQPDPAPRSYPGSTDRQERAGGLVIAGTRALLIGAAGDSGIPDVAKIGAVDLISGPRPCSLTAPPDTTMPNDPGRPGAVVTYPLPRVTGSCGPVNCLPASGSFFAIGVTDGTCTTTDEVSRAPISASFKVTVRDAETPTIARQADIRVGQRTESGATVGFPLPAASDNSGTVTVDCRPPSGSRFPVGSTFVTCQATDPHGNGAISAFEVTVTPKKASVKASPATGTAEVSLDAPGPGRMTATATADSGALRASASRRVTIAKAQRTVRRAGRIRITLRPAGAAKRVLRRKGRLAVTVRVTFTPRSGAATTSTQKLTLRLRRR